MNCSESSRMYYHYNCRGNDLNFWNLWFNTAVYGFCSINAQLQLCGGSRRVGRGSEFACIQWMMDIMGLLKRKRLSRLVSSVAEVTTIYFFPKLEYNFLALTIWIYYIKINARIWINKQHLSFDYINRLLIKLFSFICISERARQTF